MDIVHQDEKKQQIDLVCPECGEVVLVDYETGCEPWASERAEAIVTALHECEDATATFERYQNQMRALGALSAQNMREMLGDEYIAELHEFFNMRIRQPESPIEIESEYLN